MGHDAPGMTRQDRQQLEFLARQVNRAPRHLDLAAGEIDAQVADRKLGRLGWPGRSLATVPIGVVSVIPHACTSRMLWRFSSSVISLLGAADPPTIKVCNADRS